VPFGDAVAFANVPTGTMRDWIRRGLLPAYRIGPRLLQIDLSDIDRLRRRVPTGGVTEEVSVPAGRRNRRSRQAS
jgi:hypothetical protein